MPAYAVPTDALDLALLAQHDQRKGQWIVMYIQSVTDHFVFGNYKSWRIADRVARGLPGVGTVYWSDGTAFWHAT